MPHQCTNCGRTFADGSKEMLSGCPDCGGNKFQFRPSAAVADTDAPSSEPSTPASTADPEESSAADQTANSGSEPDAAPASDWPDPTAESGDDGESGLTDAAARAGAAVRDRLSRNNRDTQTSRSNPDSETDTQQSPEPDTRTSPEPDSRKSTELDTGETTPADTAKTTSEDSAQATARSDVVSREELSAAARDVDRGTAPSGEPGDDPDDAPADARVDSDDTPDDSPNTQSAPVADPPSPEDGTIASSPSDTDKPNLDELREELNEQFESIKIVSPGQYELNLMELYDRDEYIISLQEDGRYVIEVPDRWREDE